MFKSNRILVCVVAMMAASPALARDYSCKVRQVGNQPMIRESAVSAKFHQLSSSAEHQYMLRLFDASGEQVEAVQCSEWAGSKVECFDRNNISWAWNELMFRGTGPAFSRDKFKLVLVDVGPDAPEDAEHMLRLDCVLE